MLTEDVFWRFGSFAIYTLGVALALGFLTVTVVAIPGTRRRGLRRRDVLDLMFWLMLITVVGSRLTMIVIQWDEYVKAPFRALAVPPDGLSYYGGLVIGIVVIAWFSFKRNLRFWTVADSLAPSIGLGITVSFAIILSTNMLRIQSGGFPWTSLILFTVVYAGAYGLWRWQQHVRFEGELVLLLLAIDSILRIVVGFGWAISNGPYANMRGPLITLAIVTALWFVRRGAADRQRSEVEKTNPLHRITPAWLVGYAMFIGLILVRSGMGIG